MKAKIKVEKEFEIQTLEVQARPRYWEDTDVNGEEDTEGTLIPFKVGNEWCPVIDIDSGVIQDWPKGTTAHINYKVCDDGSYYLKSENENVVLSIEDDYVPKMLDIMGDGYGDYITMNIDENGKIADWNPTLEGFIDEEY